VSVDESFPYPGSFLLASAALPITDYPHRIARRFLKLYFDVTL
jgi:hypothetical protein